MDGARDVTFVPLVLLADVDHDRLAGVDGAARTRCVDLRDLGSHLLEQLAVRSH